MSVACGINGYRKALTSNLEIPDGLMGLSIAVLG